MKINIDERTISNEVLFFMEAETIEESSLLLRLANGMKDNNAGYVSFSGESVTGWIKIPLKKDIKTYIISGKWE